MAVTAGLLLACFEVGEGGLGGRAPVEAFVAFVFAEQAEVVGPFGVAVLFGRFGVGVDPDAADLGDEDVSVVVVVCGRGRGG